MNTPNPPASSTSVTGTFQATIDPACPPGSETLPPGTPPPVGSAQASPASSTVTVAYRGAAQGNAPDAPQDDASDPPCELEFLGNAEKAQRDSDLMQDTSANQKKAEEVAKTQATAAQASEKDEEAALITYAKESHALAQAADQAIDRAAVRVADAATHLPDGAAAGVEGIINRYDACAASRLASVTTLKAGVITAQTEYDAAARAVDDAVDLLKTRKGLLAEIKGRLKEGDDLDAKYVKLDGDEPEQPAQLYFYAYSMKTRAAVQPLPFHEQVPTNGDYKTQYDSDVRGYLSAVKTRADKAKALTAVQIQFARAQKNYADLAAKREERLLRRLKDWQPTAAAAAAAAAAAGAAGAAAGGAAPTAAPARTTT